jgi:alpha-methylacyl-CoA racemase
MAVMTMHEAPKHPHLAARGTFIEFDGHLHPAPAPRFSRTPSSIQSSPSEGRADVRSVLASWDESMSGRVKSMQSVGVA